MHRTFIITYRPEISLYRKYANLPYCYHRTLVRDVDWIRLNNVIEEKWTEHVEKMRNYYGQRGLDWYAVGTEALQAVRVLRTEDDDDIPECIVSVSKPLLMCPSVITLQKIECTHDNIILK